MLTPAEFFRVQVGIIVIFGCITSCQLRECHIEVPFVIGCTGSCKNDNFRCTPWRKCYKHDISFTLLCCLVQIRINAENKNDTQCTLPWQKNLLPIENVILNAVLHRNLKRLFYLYNLQENNCFQEKWDIFKYCPFWEYTLLINILWGNPAS